MRYWALSVVVVALQAVITSILYWGRIRNASSLFESDVIVFLLPTLLGALAHGVVGWIERPTSGVSLILLRAIGVAILGLGLSLLYSLNRWGS